jgi:two-component system sensor kinase FixL
MKVSCVVPPKPVVAFIDPLQFRRALDNLLLKAAEACAGQENARVTVSLLPAGVLHPDTEITVADNGPGIPEPILKNLFRVFVTSGKEHGIGLGLAASKRLIEAHGGTIEYLSSRKQGATFRIRVPAGLKPA